MMTSVQTSGSSEPRAAVGDDEQYDDFLSSVRMRFGAHTAGGARLFTTDAAGLFDVFLAALPQERRQHYTCNACRRFFERFGGLVTVATDGTTASALWDSGRAPEFFRGPARALAQAVGKARINGVFLSSDKVWGLPSNKSEKPPFRWHHVAVAPDRGLLHNSVVLSASQAMAEKLQDYATLCRGLTEFPIEIVRQAHALLTTGSLYRSEKCIGVAKWLLDLHEAREATKNTVIRDNHTWSAVAAAPAGFCHVRSSMIGTLLEDIAAGMAFDDIKRRFDDKMNPLQYQRPQAAPTAGNIAQAEKIVGALRTAGALERRFAKLEDIQALWVPRTSEPVGESGGGVFGHLKPKTNGRSVAHVEPPPITMTWVKFAATVLPDAESIEYLVPSTRASFSALVTAANPEAPPILQWDREDKRNPVSWYFYHGGSPAQQWNLQSDAWVKVTAVTLQPSMWHGLSLAHQGEKVFFLLDGARDTAYRTGAGFFPETLRSEYHGVRATMEAYALNAVVTGTAEATACGIGLQKGAPGWAYQFRVTSRGARVTYRLDRWD